MRQYSNKAAFISGTQNFTGSIDRIYAPASGCAVTSLEYGQMSIPYTTSSISSRYPQSDSNGIIYIPVGTYLEGPIIQFKPLEAPSCRHVIAYIANDFYKRVG